MVPAGHATNKGQMLLSCILARSLRASPHTLPSPIACRRFDGDSKSSDGVARLQPLASSLLIIRDMALRLALALLFAGLASTCAGKCTDPIAIGNPVGYCSHCIPSCCACGAKNGTAGCAQIDCAECEADCTAELCCSGHMAPTLAASLPIATALKCPSASLPPYFFSCANFGGNASVCCDGRYAEVARTA